jgi:SAM-dependent methyltransferase
VQRTKQQLEEHYLIERELADRLRNAPREQRRSLYMATYDELFQRVPHHPQLLAKTSPDERAAQVKSQIRFLKQFLGSCGTFLEVGPGDCALSFEVAKVVDHVYALDVSSEITMASSAPPNFELILTPDGVDVPLNEGSVDVAYSNQLMEHLHEEDAFDQLRAIHNALRPGGVYVCITPNRLSGPHDVSVYFDDVATGFHLKEYTTLELCHLFRAVGFSKVRILWGAKGKFFSVPGWVVFGLEKILERLPKETRRWLVQTPLVGVLLGVRLVGVK